MCCRSALRLAPAAAGLEPSRIDQVADQAAQGVAECEALVGTEAPGPFDTVLGGGVAGKSSAQRGQVEATDPEGSRNQVGQGLALAAAAVGTYPEDPGDGLQRVPGGLPPAAPPVIGVTR